MPLRATQVIGRHETRTRLVFRGRKMLPRLMGGSAWLVPVPLPTRAGQRRRSPAESRGIFDGVPFQSVAGCSGGRKPVGTWNAGPSSARPALAVCSCTDSKKRPLMRTAWCKCNGGLCHLHIHSLLTVFHYNPTRRNAIRQIMLWHYEN